MKKFKQEGITLIALVVTIVVLLILSGVSIIILTGDSGILNQSNEAETETEIASEEEIVKLSVVYAKTEGDINETNLAHELDNIPGKEKYNIEQSGEELAVTFKETKRTYLVDKEGNVNRLNEKEPEPAVSTKDTINMLYGVIEVEFLSGTSYTVGNANDPSSKLKDGMEAVYWAKDESGQIDTTTGANNTYLITGDNKNFSTSNWYEYAAQSGNNDGKTSRWANATTSDGSYYVWIPRYAYRIIYFDTQDHENEYREGTLTEEQALANGYIEGYSDSRGIVDSEGKRPKQIISTTSISVNNKYFRVHPAFDGNVNEGGWDSKLAGIWVMKYEASKPKASPTSTGSGTIPKSVPNVRSWISSKVSDMFNYAKNAYNTGETQNTTLNSHMMKNSEWGAVVYLAESKYGRNGTEISVNQCKTKITGAGSGTGSNSIYNSVYAYTSIKEEQKYAGTVGQLSSTTGNIYGIYDLSGGVWEYVMGFFQDTDGNIYIGSTTSANSGFNGFLQDGSEYKDGIEFPTDRKYYGLYQKTETDGKYLGQALFETKNWNSDMGGSVVNDSKPISVRGGNYNYTDEAGGFFFACTHGSSNKYGGFRVCCAVK